MKKQNEPIKIIIKKAVSAVVEQETREWPPKCLAFMYQPVRPTKNPTAQTTRVSK